MGDKLKTLSMDELKALDAMTSDQLLEHATNNPDILQDPQAKAMVDAAQQNRAIQDRLMRTKFNAAGDLLSKARGIPNPAAQALPPESAKAAAMQAMKGAFSK